LSSSNEGKAKANAPHVKSSNPSVERDFGKKKRGNQNSLKKRSKTAQEKKGGWGAEQQKALKRGGGENKGVLSRGGKREFGGWGGQMGSGGGQWRGGEI